MKLFRRRKKDDLRDAVGKYVARNFGEEYVAEALKDYDTLNEGGTVGGFDVTAAFLDMIGKVKEEVGI